MTTIISYTKPMSEFKDFFANGTEISECIKLSHCDQFWAKGTNAELLIYRGDQVAYSCCYKEAYGLLFITHIYGRLSGLVYEYDLDYDAIEKSLPVLSLENAKVGGYYKFAGGWMQVEKIYKVSEEYAQENDLRYLDRVTVTDWNGVQHDFALTSCNR